MLRTAGTMMATMVMMAVCFSLVVARVGPGVGVLEVTVADDNKEESSTLEAAEVKRNMFQAMVDNSMEAGESDTCGAAEAEGVVFEEVPLGAEGVLPGRHIESFLRVFKQFTLILPMG